MAQFLFASLNYAPDGTGVAPYSTGLAEALAELGHDVYAVVGYPHYPQWRKGRAPQQEFIRGVRVHRVDHHVPIAASLAGRLRMDAGFVGRGLLEVRTLRRRLDRPYCVAVSPSPGGLLLGYLAVRILHGHFYAIIQDLVGEGIAQTARHQVQRKLANAVGLFEYAFLRRAEMVFVVAQGFSRALQKNGVDTNRIRLLRNWTQFDVADVDPLTLRRHLNWNNKTVCLHSGNMGLKQGLGVIIDTADVLRDDGRFLFVLQGDGSERQRLQESARDRGLTNVRFLPIVPPHEVPAYLQAADVLLLTQLGSVTDMSLPSKLTSYMVSGTPIVASVNAGSETGAELSSSGAALIVRPEDAMRLSEAIQMIAQDDEARRALVTAARRFAATHYTRSASTRSFLEAFGIDSVEQ